MHPRRLPLVLTLACAAALIAACSSAAGSAAPGATSVATTVPAGTAAPGASANPAASVDVGAAAQGLANVNSYKMTMQVSGAEASNVEIVYVKGPPAARSITTTSGSENFRVVEIGTDVWVDEGTGTFQKNVIPKAQADAMLTAFDPLVFMQNLNKNPDIKFLQNQGVESKNTIQATHLHADSSTPLPPTASPIPPGGSIDLWVAVDGGYLVALEAKGFLTASGEGSGDVAIEVTNVNDPSLTVTPPA